MTYTRTSELLTPGTVSADAIQAWLRCAKAIRCDAKSDALIASLTQSVAVMTTFCRAALNTTIEVTRPSTDALVKAYMRCRSEDFQIIQSIISTVFVLVVDMIAGRKRSPDDLFSNEAMFSDASNTRWVIDHHVSVVRSGITAVIVGFLARRYRGIAARTRTVLRQMCLIPACLIRRSAVLVLANQGDVEGILSGHASHNLSCHAGGASNTARRSRVQNPRTHANYTTQGAA